MMTNTKYKVGELSKLISTQKHISKEQKTTEKERKKLASLFNQPKSARNVPVATPSYIISTNQVSNIKEKGKRKRKFSDTETVLSSSKQTGYDPPPGIVHEAIAKQNKKRKIDKTAKTEVQKKTSLNKKTDEEDNEAKYPPRRRRPKRDHVKESRTLFVGNLSVSVDRKHLKKLFQKFGEIESVRIRCAAPADPKIPKRVAAIRKDFHPERSTLAAFVCFKEEDAAKNALKLNGVKVNDLHLRVDVASQAKKHDHKHSVFVGNLPFNISEEDVWNHFEDCGTVANVRIIRDRKTGLGKGFGYVLFESLDSVSFALKLNGSELSGRQLRVIRSQEHHQPNKSSAADKKDRSTKKMQSKNTNSESTDKNKHIKKFVAKNFKPSNAQSSSFQGFKVDNASKKKRKKKLKKSKATKSGLYLQKSNSKVSFDKSFKRSEGKIKDGTNKHKKAITKSKVKPNYSGKTKLK